MRRSTLQRKDRDELTAIATTLGKKPSSRARKGEIIDLILDLAAGGDGSGTPGDDAPAADDAAADAAEASDTGAAAAAPTDDGDSSDAAAAKDGAEQPDAESASTGRSSEDTAGAQDADAKPEPGNHRRRRRGRDGAAPDHRQIGRELREPGAHHEPGALGLDVAFPAAFVALLAPALRRPGGLRLALTGGVIALVALQVVPTGPAVLLAGLAILPALRSGSGARGRA